MLWWMANLPYTVLVCFSVSVLMELIVRFCNLFVNKIYTLLQFSLVNENHSQVNLPENDSRLLQYKT